MPTQYTLEDFRNNLKKGAQRLIKKLKTELKATGLEMEERSKDIAFSGFKNVSGRLRQSIAGRLGEYENKPALFLQAGGQFRGNNLFYAEYIEFGTPDPPKPRLVFFGMENGKKKYRYVKRGIRPRLFLGRSFEQGRKELEPRIQKMVTAVLKGDADG